MVHVKPVVEGLPLGVAAFVFFEALVVVEVEVVDECVDETPDDVVVTEVVVWAPVVGWLAPEGPEAEDDDVDGVPLGMDVSKEPVMASSAKKGENPTYEALDVGTKAT